MSDNRFKWLLICSCLTVLLLAFIWKYPEMAKVNAGKEARLGEYVYVDPYSVAHVSRKCPKLTYKGWESTRFKVEEMYRYFYDTPSGGLPSVLIAFLTGITKH